MPRSQKGHRFILCMIDEVTNYLVTAPIYQSRSEEIVEALIENVISKYCCHITLLWIWTVHSCQC